jgi:DNA-binding response OmpR family regulator
MLKVLIVEDNVMLADILEDTLALGGYEVCGVAHSVAAAVELADLHQPDIGVFDFRLGGGEYGSHIRPRLKLNGMAVLYVSADDWGDTLTSADGEAYIQKPYGINDLLLAVHIAHEIKMNGDFFPIFCPKTFHRLKDILQETLPPPRWAA